MRYVNRPMASKRFDKEHVQLVWMRLQNLETNRLYVLPTPFGSELLFAGGDSLHVSDDVRAATQPTFERIDVLRDSISLRVDWFSPHGHCDLTIKAVQHSTFEVQN